MSNPSPIQCDVAVIGAGPAGLTAALRLAQMGYQVTVFEKLPVPGGMLTWAIPEYRLPRHYILAEVENIKRAGVEIRCNQALGRDFSLDDLFTGAHGTGVSPLQGGQDAHSPGGAFDAVVLAIGAHKARTMGIPGEDKKGVLQGIDFLREVAYESCMKAIGQEGKGQVPDFTGKRVGIVGGGDVAIDAARTAVRLGAREVHVMYRRTGDDMPATHLPEEIEAALHEGVRIHTLVNPIEVLGDEHVTGVRLQRQRLAEFDNSARRKPQPYGDSYVLPLDYLIPAIGQTPDLSWMTDCRLETTRSHTFVVNEAFATSRPVVFAAGDAVSGPATIVQAIAQGNQVAAAIDRWFKTGKMETPRFETPRHDVQPLHNIEDFADARRPVNPKLPLADRERNFREVEVGFDEQTASREAMRCLRCDLEWLATVGAGEGNGEEVGKCESEKVGT